MLDEAQERKRFLLQKRYPQTRECPLSPPTSDSPVGASAASFKRNSPGWAGSFIVPVRISIFYFLFGIVWILLADFLLVWSQLASPNSYLVSSVKGVIFVGMSSVLIYFLLRQHVKSESRANALARAVIDGAMDAVFVKDREGRYLLCNATVAEVANKSIEEIIGHDDHELFNAESANLIMHRDREIMASGLEVTSEEVLTTNGETRTYLASKAPFRDATGAVVGLIGVSRDITERKREELQLRDERDRFECIVETVPLVITSFQRRADGTFCFPYASPKIVDFYGLTPDELAHDASSCFAILAPEDLKRVIANIDQSAKDMKVWHDKFKLNSPVLGEIWATGAATPTRQSDGSIIWHGYINNVTDRHRAEISLQEIQERLKEAQITANMGSWTWDSSTNEVWWSEAIFDLFGFDPKSTAPSFEGFLSLLDEGDRDVAVKRVERLLQGGDGFADELQIRRPDGRAIWIYSVGRATRDESGKLLRVNGFDQDISDRRRLEDQLRQSQKMEAVGRLAGGVAHDFNNLLTVIQGYCEVLQFNLPDENKNRLSVEAIQKAAERATLLTRQLLAFSRKAMIETRTLNLNDVVLQIEIMLRRLIATNIKIDISLAPEPCYIEADPTQIDQVILNLALNSRDAMLDGGKLSISTKRVSIPQPELAVGEDVPTSNLIELRVSDTGHGMTDEVKSRIFEPFFTTKEKGKGTGLGLAVVHGIVNQSRGQISVESNVDRGTSFRILLNEVAPAKTELAVKQSGESRGTDTILLVEDEDSVRRLLSDTLESFGYTVLTASSGQEAIKLAGSYNAAIHLLITDLMMPQMGGRELSNLLRDSVADLRVLYISGYFEDTVIQQGIRDGIDAFLHKPFSPLNLARKVRSMLDEPKDSAGNP